MPHEIDTTTGTAAVLTVGEPPWHGLGRNVQDAPSSDRAIELAGLDWLVEQWAVQAMGPDGWGAVTARGFLANVRSDTKAVLGVVSPLAPAWVLSAALGATA